MMAPRRIVLILLLLVFIQIVLFSIARMLDLGGLNSVLYWTIMGASLALVAYSFQIKCKNPTCGRRQVFRGLSIFDLRLPSNHCYFCSTPLGQVESKS